MIRKILLADSGTGKSEEMLKMLLNLESIKAASISILNVIPSQNSSDILAQKQAESETRMQTAIESLKLPPAQISTLIREGDPKVVVCQVADELDTDLIIMGSRGLSRLQSILQNSVSQYVFQLSGKPMLLVKDDIFVKRLNRIMVAFDSSPSATQCLDLALSLLRDIPGGQLILGHSGSNRAFESAEADPVLAPAIAKAKQAGLAYRCYSATAAKPGPDICRTAADSNADLLIMGSPDRRPSVAKSMPDLDRLLGSSTSDYVRVNATCPVLLSRTSGDR